MNGIAGELLDQVPPLANAPQFAELLDLLHLAALG
jgi:hypothetical protein